MLRMTLYDDLLGNYFQNRLDSEELDIDKKFYEVN